MGNNYIKISLLSLLFISLTFGGFAQTGNAYAISLDGAESFYVNDDALNNLDLTGSYTFECWFNVDTYQAYDRIFDRRTVFAMSIIAANGTGDFALRFTERGSTHSVLRTLETSAAYDMDLDTWYHVAVTYNASTNEAKLIINGNLAASETNTNWSLTASTNGLNIGGLYNSGYSNQIDAHIDEVRVSNIARSISNMQTSNSREEYSSDANTVLLMHLDDKADPPTYVSGNGLTGTTGDDDIDNVDYTDSRIGSTNFLLRPNYQSKAAGNWGDASTWNYYKDGTTWTAATLVPDAYTPEINIQGGYTVTSAGTLTINGDLTIASGSAFTDNGTTKFSGSSAQTIPSATYNNLEIDNTSGVSLGGAVSVKSILTLTDGILTSTSTNLLTFTSTASAVSGGSNSAYVDGPIAKVGSTDFVFPTGNGGKWARIAISGLSASETFTAEYHKTTPADNTTMTAPLTKVSDNEWWDLKRLGSIDADVTFYWEDSKWSGIGDFGDLRLAHWNSTSSKWEEEAGTYSNSGAVSLTASNSGTLKVTGVSSFSPFAPGSIDNTTNTLPVELLSFSLLNQNNTIELNWATASELNNQGFEIQRSNDAQNWEVIGFVNGAGNSNQMQDYTFTDNTPQVFNYYRLKQIDFDGAYSLSEIKFLKLGKTNSLSIYPNPVVDFVNISQIETSDAKQILLYDVAGRLVQEVDVNTLKLDVSNLQQGYYYFVLTNRNGQQSVGRFMKK